MCSRSQCVISITDRGQIGKNVFQERGRKNCNLNFYTGGATTIDEIQGKFLFHFQYLLCFRYFNDNIKTKLIKILFYRQLR